MKATLSLNFNPDHDEVAVVTAKVEAETVMVITVNFCAGPHGNDHQIVTSEVNGSLTHTTQAKIILVASELIDSIFTGKEVPSTVWF